MRNEFFEVESNGIDMFKAKIGNKIFTVREDKIWSDLSSNFDDVAIIEVFKDNIIKYYVLDYDDSVSLIKNIAHDEIKDIRPFINDSEMNMLYATYDEYSIIEDADIEDLIYELKKDQNIFIRTFDLYSFINSDIEDDKIISVLKENNII